jgi:peptidoglycan-associated lipoprotein
MRGRLRLIELSILVCLVGLTAACHKRTPAAAAPTEAPAAAAPPPTPGPPTCTLTATPATVSAGQAVTLDWTSANATTVNLNPGLGKQQAEGSTAVTPSASTTYAVSASGPGGTGECSARVTVMSAAAPSPSVSESNIPPGNASVSNALEDVFFDFSKADLKPEAQTALSRDASYLKDHPDVKIQIGGYCDQRGSEEYNLGLGERRAEAAERYLANLGVATERMTTISYGKDRPFCTESTEDCYQKNRRAHMALVQQHP